MSRTDKTRPWWVQLRDPGLGLSLRVQHSIWHHMRHGADCVPQFPVPVTRRPSFAWSLRNDPSGPGCEIWTRYDDHEKLWGRSGWRRRHPGMQGRARASLRQLQADWRKTAAADRDAIDSTLDAPTSRWVWRHWYWD